MGFLDWLFGEDSNTKDAKKKGINPRNMSRGEQLAKGGKRGDGWFDLDFDEDLQKIHEAAQKRKNDSWW